MSWEAPEEQFTGYSIWLLGVADTRRSFNAGTRTTSLRDLVAGQKYTVVLAAVSGDQESAELTGSFYTSKSSVNGCNCMSKVTLVHNDSHMKNAQVQLLYITTSSRARIRCS